MTIELSIVISCISVFFAVFFGWQVYKRNTEIDTSSSTYNRAKTDVLLESISTDVRDIKAEQKQFRNDMSTELTGIKDRVLIVEQSCKSAHKRIDKIEKEEEE